MRVVFGADDENDCTRAVVEHLRGLADLRVLDGGSWPEFARAAGQAVAGGDADFAVLMCWTGTGTSIAANKVPGVRAALAWEPWIAANARRWNDANVLALSLKRLAPDVAVECVRAFLEVTAEDPDESATIDLIRELLPSGGRPRWPGWMGNLILPGRGGGHLLVVVGAGVGGQVVDGLGGGVGDAGVDGELVFAAVVDGAEVEDGQEPFDQGGRGVGDDVAQGGQLVQ